MSKIERMENLRDTRWLLQRASNKMRAVETTLNRFRDLIQVGEFDFRLWRQVNIPNINEMISVMNHYKLSYRRSQNVIDYYDYYHFNWHHLIDLYSRENPEWVRQNLTFLDQQIHYTQEMLRLCVEELNHIEGRMNAMQLV